ncbi:armadillo-like helical domain-containing protein 2 [Notamacropus eugenii]|uniref:armadillo-like helical domain-containing protein 2 n=1 Tax=Notamacropus eugenii TaxID=9315 RepID=UPI003B678319
MDKQRNICLRFVAVVIGMFTKTFSFFKNFRNQKAIHKKMNVVDSIFHKEKIIILGYQLKNKTLTLERRAQAAFRLGLLAYTGGPIAAKWVADYMNDIVVILQRDNISPQIRVTLLQSLASWCYLNVFGQKRATVIKIIPILVSFLEEETPNFELKGSKLHVKFWSCYLLAVIICNNGPAIQELANYTTLKFSLQMLASEHWLGWPENFAEVLFFLLGYHRT